MAIIDRNNFLSESEQSQYEKLLNKYGHRKDDFLLEIVEDQGPMDMNDINYVIIIKTKATHIPHQKSKTYLGSAGSGTWLSQFEEDLKKGYFNAG